MICLLKMVVFHINPHKSHGFSHGWSHLARLGLVDPGLQDKRSHGGSKKCWLKEQTWWFIVHVMYIYIYDM